jgi:hypothetical protein
MQTHKLIAQLKDWGLTQLASTMYVEHGSPHHQGLRWFKAAEIVIGHNHELTE